MYRIVSNTIQVFIAHPGGPWFPNREFDVWTIPKGELEPGEDLLTAAVREFEEEVGIKPTGPYLDLGSIRQKGGKIVYAWGFSGNHDSTHPISSNCVEIEWPPGSGCWGAWPEIDRAGFFSLHDAKARLKTTQHPFLDRLISNISC
jgi:predicted NUDIX family NTP pyrophosphohydrolase